MGKGARNRKRRIEQKSAAQAKPVETAEALNLILEAETDTEFENLVASRPSLLSAETEAEFIAMASLEGFESTGEALAKLLADARRDPQRAWEHFQRTWSRLENEGAALEPESNAIDAAINAGNHEEVIARVDRLLPRARAAGLGVAVGLLHTQRGTAYVLCRDGDRAENLESAITDFGAAIRLVISDQQRAEVLMHAGIAYMERVYGDRAENIEQAIALLREALSELDEDSPPQLEAIVRTNLAAGLLRRERGDRSEAHQEAADLCLVALDYRSPETNADDWAYSQINLGLALRQLAAEGIADPDSPARAYESVIAESDQIKEQWLVGSAHHEIARLERGWALPSTEEQAEAAAEGIELEADRDLLKSARTHLETARPLVSDSSDYLLRGRVAMDLSAVRSDLGDDGEETLEIAREALSILRPTAAPFDCVEVGFRLGGILAERGEWAGSAEAYRDAVEAAELTFHSRLETESRESDIRGMGTLFRWAAFSIAAAGNPLEAALALESGRAREIRRRLGLERSDADRLDSLPRELADRYSQALAELLLAPIGSPAGRELQETLELIRSIDGFEDFATGARPAELAAAVEPDWPLAYVNPSPWGTLLLVVSADEHGPCVESFFLDRLNALDVYLRLLAGDAAAGHLHIDDVEPSSLLALVAGVSNQPPEQDLDQALPWLGENLAKPLLEAAEWAEARGLTVVPCGPVAVAPLHAAPWENERSGQRYLLEEIEVRYAQSALITATGIRRASKRQVDDAALVALANPTRDLAAAEPEVREISKHFPLERQRLAAAADATASFLRENAADATHLHLACHARGGLIDSEASAAILLSDGWLAAEELTQVGGIRARLAVVSACQSAVGSITDLSDEAISIGSVIMAAGAACVIVSLWPVHDLATGLLMARLYEELFDGHGPPSKALRLAQFWLRELSQDEEQEFLGRHPSLRAEFSRRSASGGLPGHRPATYSASARPYEHEYYWAGFVAVGA